MKNPSLVFIFYVFMLTVTLSIVVALLYENHFKVTWDEFCSNGLLLNSVLALAFLRYAWKAYRAPRTSRGNQGQ